MGAKIDIFLKSFNDGLLEIIKKKELQKSNFDKAREEAVKISELRMGAWPNNSAIKTIGDLLGYSFPGDGSTQKKPNGNIYNVANPEYLTYLEDVKNSNPATAKLYSTLKDNFNFNPC